MEARDWPPWEAPQIPRSNLWGDNEDAWLARLAGDYEGAAADFGQAQRIDFDPDVRPDLVYCSTRSAKIRAIKLAEEHNAALDAAKAEGEAQ